MEYGRASGGYRRQEPRSGRRVKLGEFCHPERTGGSYCAGDRGIEGISGQWCKDDNASCGEISFELVPLEQLRANERSTFDTQDADAPHLSLPVDVRRVEIEHALAGISERDYPRRGWWKRQGCDDREREGKGTIVTCIDDGRDLPLLVIWPCNMQSNRRFQVGVDDPVDHGSSSSIRPERV